jgi:hypothetical protein
MKTASVQHLNNLVANREYTSYHIELTRLRALSSSLINKVMSVSPFLLLLVPVFMVMAYTIVSQFLK